MSRVPTYLPEEGLWEVETPYGVEQGCLEYVCSEFCRKGLIYHFKTEGPDGETDHEHTFAGVLCAVLAHPEGFEGEYSEQERRFLKKLQQAMREGLSG